MDRNGVYFTRELCKRGAPVGHDCGVPFLEVARDGDADPLT